MANLVVSPRVHDDSTAGRPLSDAMEHDAVRAVEVVFF